MQLFGELLICLRRFSFMLRSAFGYPSNLVSLHTNRPSVSMASLDPIDISSSDSDSDLREIDNYRDESPIRDTSSSVPPRILPAWMSQLAVRQDPSSSSSSSSKRQNFAHNNNSSRPRKHLHITESYGPSSLMIDGNNRQQNSSNNSGRLVTSPNIHSSHQSLKRSLPTSFQSSTSNMRSSSPVENVVASELRGMYANSSNGNNLMKENSIWGSGSSSSLYEKKGNRLLPPSLVPGKHTSPSTFVSSNDPFHHTGIIEEGPAGADESLVFRAAVQDLRQPTLEANLPEGLLAVPLLRHQKIALAWMLSKESSGLCLGGILADDQGLGKTVSTIALIQMQRHLEKKAKNKVSCNSRTEALNLDDDGGISGLIALDDASQIKESDDFAILPRESNMIKGFRSRRPTAGTLIVCPASVLRQWARELDEKVTSEAKLSVLVYHGGQRTKDPAALAKYDAVLTTYAIVTNEVPKQPLVEEDDDEQKDGELYGLSSAFSMEKKRKKPSANKKSKKGKKDNDVSAFDSNSGTLDRVKWSRVVLDESQTIKNHRTQVARACCSLRAKRRWCLSGTPIQNSVDELYSYFRFLRYDPYDKFKKFSSSIKSFILRDSVKGYKKLQVILMNIMLRRTKGTLIDGQPIITLPPKKVHLMRVDFSIEERTFYDRLESDSRKQFKDPPENAVVTMCGHVFCYQCVSDYLTGEDNTCPASACKEQLGADVVFSKSTLTKCIYDGIDGDNPVSKEHGENSVVVQSNYVSSKIKSALEILKSHCVSKRRQSSELYHLASTSSSSANCSESTEREKAIVFSQWTSMLDLVEMSLKNSCISYRRLDGTMSIPARDKAVKDFNTDPEVDVMLMSLKAGNLGLNMVAACRVILLDLWWNPTTEDQAIDRAHRIGQTRPVTVSRLTIKDTVEDRILALQEDKRKMVASAFGEDQSGGQRSRLTVEDLRFLFEGR
ncbi:SNF2 domain-containing protein [Striga asiatica]|uniref:SNF2 domain-containing protein n=1 Tax=Striga asiatica TaxID=4170 RepID=A0A5A7QG64_STRAF|nr:SNF2 domain-containing protein [Striga asiatica]